MTNSHVARAARSFVATAVARIVLVVALSAQLAACLDVEQNLHLDAEGGASLDVALRFDREMEDIANAVTTRAENLLPLPGLDRGVCPALEFLAPPVPGTAVTANQGIEGERFVCRVRAQLDDVKLLEQSTQFSRGSLRLESQGERMYSLTFDLRDVPDLSEWLQDEINRRLEESLGLPAPDRTQAILDSDRKAALALVSMLMRDRTISFSISGAEVLDSNGEISPDRKTATFRFTYRELAKVSLRPDTPNKKAFYALVRY